MRQTVTIKIIASEITGAAKMFVLIPIAWYFLGELTQFLLFLFTLDFCPLIIPLICIPDCLYLLLLTEKLHQEIHEG